MLSMLQTPLLSAASGINTNPEVPVYNIISRFRSSVG